VELLLDFWNLAGGEGLAQQRHQPEQRGVIIYSCVVNIAQHAISLSSGGGGLSFIHVLSISRSTPSA
jgi:hypothetical protein